MLPSFLTISHYPLIKPGFKERLQFQMAPLRVILTQPSSNYLPPPSVLNRTLGWVSYATSAINSAVGENKLMPGADTPCTIINPDSGQSRSNGSWVLGRMMRDFEVWMHKDIEEKVIEIRKAKWDFDRDQEEKKGGDRNDVKKPAHAGLVVSFWEIDSAKRSAIGQPGRDVLFWSGVVVSILQLGVAAIPFGVYGDWGILLVTAAAILLCLGTGAQKQWKREKWACREIEPGKKRTYIMTRGNGAQHAIVVQCNGCGLNFEDLCTGFDNLDSPSISLATRLAMVGLGVLWVCLLITSSALTQSAWFLIAVGGMGMLQNIFVAGWSREPEALGIPLKYNTVIGFPRVIDTIYEVERQHPKVGRSLAGVFFPGSLRDHEEEKLKGIEDEGKTRKMEAKKPAD